MNTNIKDMGSGVMFLVIGLAFTWNAWRHLPLTTDGAIGPGSFPLGISLIVTGFGVGLIIKAMRTAPEGLTPISWRGLTLIVLSVLVFALFIERLGGLPALLASTFLAAIAPSDSNWKTAVIVTVALTAFCIGVFIYALGLPYPVIGPWLRLT